MRKTILDRIGKVCIPVNSILYIYLLENATAAEIHLKVLDQTLTLLDYRSYVLRVVQDRTTPGHAFIPKASDFSIIEKKFHTSAQIRVTNGENGHLLIALFNVKEKQIANAMCSKKFSKLSLCEAGAIVLNDSLWLYEKGGWSLFVTDKDNIIALNGTDGTTIIGGEICSIA